MVIITTLQPRELIAILVAIGLVLLVSIGLYVTRPKKKSEK